MQLQNYLMINTISNVVENLVYWDGDVQTWQPPPDYLMLTVVDTPAEVWASNEDKTDWFLTTIIGAGQIGHTWDGTKCITNEPKPVNPVQPVTSGTQEL